MYYRVCFSLRYFLIPETLIAVYQMMSVGNLVVNMGIQIVSFEAVLVCFHVCDCMCISDHRSKLYIYVTGFQGPADQPGYGSTGRSASVHSLTAQLYKHY